MSNSGFEIQEFGTERYPSLDDAQQAGLPHLAELLACIVHQGIEKGSFVIVDGVVRHAERCESLGTPDRGFTSGENVV